MIDYNMLASAADQYEECLYKRIEAPWLVTKPISDITKPQGCSTFMVQKDTEDSLKAFVASGEQSFLYLINKGFLPDGSYQTITPCLRNDSFDALHTKYFMKLELITFSTEVSLHGETLILKHMINDALSVMKSFMNEEDHCRLHIVKTGDYSYDINYDGTELGSYGWRECSFCNWFYGTGLAEPRFSRASSGGKHGLS